MNAAAPSSHCSADFGGRSDERVVTVAGDRLQCHIEIPGQDIVTHPLMTRDVLSGRLLLFALPQVHGHAQLHLHRDQRVAGDEPPIATQADELRVEVETRLQSDGGVASLLEGIRQAKECHVQM